jgi:hypothetical protein
VALPPTLGFAGAKRLVDHPVIGALNSSFFSSSQIFVGEVKTGFHGKLSRVAQICVRPDAATYTWQADGGPSHLFGPALAERL